MSLTKHDLEAIKSIFEQSLDHAITHRIKPMIDAAVEDLRLQTAAGFNEMDARFALVDKRFELLEGQVNGSAKDIKRMKNDLVRINGELHIMNKRFNRVDKQEDANQAHFTEQDMRIGRLEKHTGLSPA
jgi:hypothetical protein